MLCFGLDFSSSLRDLLQTRWNFYDLNPLLLKESELLSSALYFYNIGELYCERNESSSFIVLNEHFETTL